MKWLPLCLLALSLLFLSPLGSKTTQASTNCHATGNWCVGWAQVSTKTGGVLGTDERCFSLRETNSAPSCATTTSNEATFDFQPGNCITLYYFDTSNGATAPAAPNKMQIGVRIDGGTTFVILYVNMGAEPSNGQSFSFCATDTGLNTGSPRAGTYHIFLRAIKDNGAGGVGNYDIRDDGTALVGTISTRDQGMLRSDIIVSSITRSSYPSGSTFSYGSSADEQVTITSTFTQPNENGATETMQDCALDSSTITTGKCGSSAGSSSTTLAQALTIDTGFTAGTFVPTLKIIGSDTITSLPWTRISTTGNGGTIVRDGDTQAHDSTTFNIDGNIKLSRTGETSYSTASDEGLEKIGSSSGAVATLFNRGEVIYFEVFIYNSRSELLSRAMTFSVQDATPTNCISIGSLTPTANKYSTTFTVSTTLCLAAQDFTGSSRHYLVTNTGETHTGATSFFVSSLYATDVHTQKSSTLIHDEWPTPQASEDTTFIISSDTTNIWCHVESVREDGTQIHTATNAVVVKLTEVDDTTVLGTTTTQTGIDGWTPTPLVVNPAAPSRTVNAHCDGTFNGNTITDKQSIGWISAFTADKICRLSLNAVPTNGTSIRLYIHTEKNGGSINPDIPPTITIDSGTHTTNPDTWVNRLPTTTLKNAVDNTATVNGPLYYFDWTPTVASTPSFLVMCRIEGAPLQFENPVTVQANSMDITFSGSISNPGLYFWIELTFWCIVFWYCFHQRDLFTLVFALGGVWHLVNPAWAFGLDKSLPWMFLGLLLNYIVKNFGHKNRNKENKT